ncbi:MAG: hypothetical protein ACK5O8_11870, partial [Pirellula sp.]
MRPFEGHWHSRRARWDSGDGLELHVPCVLLPTRTECEEFSQRNSKTLDRALRPNASFVLLLVLVLSIAVL